MKRFKLYQGDNMVSLKKLPDNSIDSIVSDPPYGLSFMGKKWDYDVPTVEFWKEVYRVLKPGGHILSFGGTRTYHRMVVNIEDAGFEIRDQIMWIYSTGFPKSHNIGKAVDKLNGDERQVVGEYIAPDGRLRKGVKKDIMPNATDWDNEDRIQTKGNSEYEGWGTALKPANEPICLARKPLSEKSVAENVIKWKTGGINIDGCRVGYTNEADEKSSMPGSLKSNQKNSMFGIGEGHEHNTEGRFPANLIFECCCDEVIKGEGDIHTNPNCPCYMLDQQSGVSKSTPSLSHTRKGNVVADERTSKSAGLYGDGSLIYGSSHNDKGGASRFFYNAKVSKTERNMGLDEFEERETNATNQNWKCQICNKYQLSGNGDICLCENPDWKAPINRNHHPTVKPVSLMTYLCRLITPENGIILDPFMGSGSTGIAAQLEGFRFVGMEMDEDYMKIAEARIESYEKYKKFIK